MLVGWSLGAAEGAELVGLSDGMLVGWSVGCSVGSTEGSELLGESDGMSVGWSVGWLVGATAAGASLRAPAEAPRGPLLVGPAGGAAARSRRARGGPAAGGALIAAEVKLGKVCGARWQGFHEVIRSDAGGER